MPYTIHFPEILSLLKNLSFQAMGYSSPNPPVACVITDLNGKILSQGHTQRHGENHAEREAYRHFAEKFSSSKEIPHLVFVTLEPCTHFGKTPPCLDLILEYKPVCVYYGLSDPNPLLANRNGMEECKKAGIEMSFSQEIAEIGKAFLTGFISRIEKNRPQVFLKSALSIDGFYSDISKSRISLSNSLSNRMTQMLRAKLDAVIVGPGTVFYDSPGLDFRELNTEDNIDLAKLSTSNQNELASPNSLFFKTLVENTFDSRICEFHNSKFKFYQPYRIFLISMKKIPSSEFLLKQKKINENLESKKAMFLLLDFDTMNNVHNEFYLEIEDLSYLQPKIISNKEEIYSTLLRTFTELSLNTILVEGGNLLYELFSENWQDYDFIYLIRTDKNISNGILPNLEMEGRKKYFELKLDTNLWEGYGV